MTNKFFHHKNSNNSLTSTPKIGHKHISTTYHPHPHVNSIDQPLTYHDLLSPNIDTLLIISLQMSICSMSKSMIAQQKMIKTPPLLVMSKIKNYRTSSTHMTKHPHCMSVNLTHFLNSTILAPRSCRKKNGCHI